MSQLIPFEQSKLPAHIAARFAATGPSALTQNVGAGYPIVSIKGKVFHIVRGDERILVTKPGDDDPAGSIEAIILDANPNLSKTYYPGGYEEGSADKPTCFSNDGLAPSPDAAEPQSTKCAICPHNVFGSRITESGGKGKACSDFRRLAISTVGTPSEAMLLRVPAATLKVLAAYGDMLTKRGVDFSAVVTKIGFDHTVAHPALTFKPLAFIDEATAAAVVEVKASEHIKAVIGLSGAYTVAPAPKAPADAPPKAAAAAEGAAKVIEKAKAPPKPKPTPAPAPEPEAAAPAPAPAPTVQVVDSKAAGDIASMLAGIEFDD